MSNLQTPFLVLVSTVGDVRCAFPLGSVARVFQAVEITPLPGAPGVIRGVINVRDALIPVADFRRRLGFDAKALHPDDKFILSKTSRPIIIVVDAIEGILELSDKDLDEIRASVPEQLPPPFVGVGKTVAGLILVYDLEQFLSLGEENALRSAMEGSR